MVLGVAQKREPVTHTTSFICLQLERSVDEELNEDERYVCHVPEVSGRCREGHGV